jgi:hypothetical protein
MLNTNSGTPMQRQAKMSLPAQFINRRMIEVVKDVRKNKYNQPVDTIKIPSREPIRAGENVSLLAGMDASQIHAMSPSVNEMAERIFDLLDTGEFYCI